MNFNYIGADDLKDKDEFVAFAEHVVAGYKELKSIYDAFLQTAKEMNGKVCNVRFVNAVQDKIKNVGYIHYGYDYHSSTEKHFSFSLNNRSYQYRGLCVYFDKKIHYTTPTRFDDKKGMWVYGIVDGNDRISFDLAKSIYDFMLFGRKTDNESEKSGIYHSIELWQDAIDNYDKYTCQIKNTLKQINDTFESMNQLFRPIRIESYDWTNGWKYIHG